MTARNCRSLYADGGAAIAASDCLSTVAQEWFVKLAIIGCCSSFKVSGQPYGVLYAFVHSPVLILIQNLKTLQEHPKIARLTIIVVNSLLKFANTLLK